MPVGGPPDSGRSGIVTFHYQDLDVYYIAQGLLETMVDFMKKAGSKPDPALVLLEKSILDIPLTIARVSGETMGELPPEKILLVRGLVYECQAMTELLWRRKLLTDKTSDELSDTLMVIANMLTDLAAEHPDSDTRKLKQLRKPKTTPGRGAEKIPIYKPRKPLLE
jgi:hypothetical protein